MAFRNIQLIPKAYASHFLSTHSLFIQHNKIVPSLFHIQKRFVATRSNKKPSRTTTTTTTTPKIPKNEMIETDEYKNNFKQMKSVDSPDLDLNSYDPKSRKKPVVEKENPDLLKNTLSTSRPRYKGSTPKMQEFLDRETHGKMVSQLDTQVVASSLTAVLENPKHKILKRYLSEDITPEVYWETREKNLGNYVNLFKIIGYQGKPEQAIQAYQDMRSHNIDPSEGVFAHLFRSCFKSANVTFLQRFRRLMTQASVEMGVVSADAYIKTLIKCKLTDEAFSVMEDLISRSIRPDAVIFTTLIHGCIKQKMYDRAWNTYDSMALHGVDPDPITYATLMYLCAQTDMAERAVNFYEEMQQKHIPVIDHAYTALIHACAKRGDSHNTALAYKFFKKMMEAGYAPDKTAYICVLTAASNFGDVASAESIFKEMENKAQEGRYVQITDRVYTLLINAYAKGTQKFPPNATKYIEKVQALLETKKILVSTNIAEATLKIYTYGNLVKASTDFLQQFRNYNIKPTLSSYGYVLAMLCRLRRMEESFEFFETIKEKGLKPHYLFYKAIIRGCGSSGYYKKGMEYMREMVSQGFKPHIDDFAPFKYQCRKFPEFIKEMDQLMVRDRDLTKVHVPPW